MIDQIRESDPRSRCTRPYAAAMSISSALAVAGPQPGRSTP